jgi:predicted nuclease with RNAse H fold
LVAVDCIPGASSPADGEARIRDRVAHLEPGDVVVIDAPLTLPPALRSGVLGLSSDGIVGEMWEHDWHPVTARECEFYLHVRLGLRRPGNTMMLGMIAARAILLAADLRRRGVIVLETYPRAAREQLASLTGDARWDGTIGGRRAVIAESDVLPLSPNLDAGSLSADMLDAILCAVVGLRYLEGHTFDPPHARDESIHGWIRIPSA